MAASVDFHCHLDLYSDTELAFREAAESHAYVLSVTTTPSAWRGTVSRAQGKRTRTALGLHPQLAHERERECALFEALLPDVRYVGEVGLDGSEEYRAYFAAQTRVFERVLRACQRVGGRVLSVHSRGAATDALDLLGRYSDAGTPILHWFTGTKPELRRAIEQDCWFSVGPAMLATQRGRTLVAAMPRHRILTETDGPFAKLAGRPLRPAQVSSAIEALGEVWGEPSGDVSEQIEGNLRELVRVAGAPA